jgi:hypothetical protein
MPAQITNPLGRRPKVPDPQLYNCRWNPTKALRMFGMPPSYAGASLITFDFSSRSCGSLTSSSTRTRERRTLGDFQRALRVLPLFEGTTPLARRDRCASTASINCPTAEKVGSLSNSMLQSTSGAMSRVNILKLSSSNSSANRAASGRRSTGRPRCAAIERRIASLSLTHVPPA